MKYEILTLNTTDTIYTDKGLKEISKLPKYRNAIVKCYNKQNGLDRLICVERMSDIFDIN